MADHMKFAGFLLALLSGLAAAEALPDPTRPPGGAAGEFQAGEGIEGAVPRLQSVFLPQQGKPAAIIDGRMVRLGDKIGDGRLTRLSEIEAVIVGAQGIQRLRLTPEAEKVTVPEKGDKKAATRKKEAP